MPCADVQPAALFLPSSRTQKINPQFANISEWRQSVASFGLDFGDGLPELLDLRFADDLLLFARSAQDAAKLLDDLVRCCSGVGLRLNVTKTKIVTSEAQAPAQLLTPAGSIVDILPPDASHKWLGCLLSSKGSRASSADVDFHLQAASRAFFLQTNKFSLIAMFV